MPPPLPEDDSELDDFGEPIAEGTREASVDDFSEDVEMHGNVKEETPATKPKRESKRAVEQSPPEEDEDEDGEDDEEDEVYVVEAIKKHMVDEDGTIKFFVKWEGYDKKADMTWEPEDTLREGAEEVLETYLAKVGGRDAVINDSATAAKGKKRGRQSIGGAAGAKKTKNNGTHPSESTPPATAKKWAPPAGSWEDQIDNIEAVEPEKDGRLLVYLVWNNGQKTKHETNVVYKKCPQKMLKFYERHIRVVGNDDTAA